MLSFFSFQFHFYHVFANTFVFIASIFYFFKIKSICKFSLVEMMLVNAIAILLCFSSNVFQFFFFVSFICSPFQSIIIKVVPLSLPFIHLFTHSFFLFIIHLISFLNYLFSNLYSLFDVLIR